MHKNMRMGLIVADGGGASDDAGKIKSIKFVFVLAEANSTY
jgi:hypothetical protein